MLPEPANCPLCGTSAERLRARELRGFRYTCPSCGTFGVDSAVLVNPAMPLSAREDVKRLRAFGHLPHVQLGRDGVHIVPGRT